MILRNGKWREYGKHLFAALFLLTLMIPTSFNVLAAEPVDVDRNGELSLRYDYNGQNLAGAQFSLYRAADIDVSGKYTLSGAFGNYSVNVNNLDSTGWKAAAKTLSVYAAADKIAPLQVKTTDRQGFVDFGALPAGLYLLKAGEMTIGSNTYSTSPFLVSLPNGQADGTWNYTVMALPKAALDKPDDSPSGPGDKPGSSQRKITVIKVWNDDSGRQRPASIRVSLLKDEEVYRTVTLNSSNYWRHTWSGLSFAFSWDVIEEEVPEGYMVTYTDEGAVYKITNSILEEIPDGEVPMGGPGNPDAPGGDDPLIIEDGEVPLGGLLPKTGLLLWPVPFLALGGLVLFGIGYKDYFGRKRKQDED